MAKSLTVTVFIGRFQPFHKGHAHVLEEALKNSDHVLVLVGSSFQSRTIKNPFTFAERRVMIDQWCHTIDGAPQKVSVLPLRDQPYNDTKWCQSVQETVETQMRLIAKDQGYEVCLGGSDRDDSTKYLSAFPQYRKTLSTGVPHGGDLSATLLRFRLFESVGRFQPGIWNDVPDTTLAFLHAFVQTDTYQNLRQEFLFMEEYRKMWRAAPYPVTFSTVDSVIIQSGHVLVVERGALPGRGLWALPGGFLNQNERLLDGAIRETIEETGLKLTSVILKGSLKAKEIFDDPNRSLRGRTITTAFLFRLDDTKPLPKVKGQNMPLHESGGEEIVETAKAFWLPINDARAQSERWFEDHHAILDTMLGMVKD